MGANRSTADAANYVRPAAQLNSNMHHSPVRIQRRLVHHF